MTIASLSDRLARSRSLLLLVALSYAFAIHFAHYTYLNPVWGYYGFSYQQPGAIEFIAMACLIMIGSIFLPTVLSRPSSIVLLLLFTVVYVPTVVISLSLNGEDLYRYGPSLGLLGLGFAAASVAARARRPSPAFGFSMPGNAFLACIVTLWTVCAAILVAKYYSIMSFAGLSEIYLQREAGASTTLSMGYVQTYFSNVFSPALIALGLVRSRWKWVLIGSVGCLLMYLINAQRTVIMLPFAIIGMFLVLKIDVRLIRSSALLMASLALAVVLSVTFYVESVAASFFSLFLVFRTIGLPGLTFSQYYDVFSTEGFTWWSHVRGLSLLIQAPAAYASDSNWPNLGFMIGDKIYGMKTLNANANLFSGDGVAAAGAIGVAVISSVFALWLRWLDKASIGWSRTFVMLVIVPVALSLTNGHLFTTLLSFGGLFWMLTFYLYKPGRVHDIVKRQSV